MGLKDLIFERTWVYRLIQAPWADEKFAPVRAHTDLAAVRRVLDVGCGPGTNAAHFGGADYLGVDINPGYIDYARRRWGRRFEVADVTTLPEFAGPFDFVLVNSFLHHVDDAAAARILAHVARLVAPEGFVHIVELVLPPRPSPARLLARLDRGRYARPLDAWRRLFEAALMPVVFEPFGLRGAGMTLWEMVYCKARRRDR